MKNLIDAIGSATAPDASVEARAAGARACRTILAALEAKDGEPIASPPPSTAVHAVPTAPPSTPMQAVLTALANTPPEQLLDLAIAKLRAALPAGTDVPAVQSVKIPLLPIANLGDRS